MKMNSPQTTDRVNRLVREQFSSCFQGLTSNRDNRMWPGAKKSEGPVKKAILFGSYAKGNCHDWSDIDLALVSDAFEGERFRDRNKIRRIKLDISCDLEPLPYRPQDFTTDDPFVQKIIETGMRVVFDE
jgi:predicted nucleotidyltransferase